VFNPPQTPPRRGFFGGHIHASGMSRPKHPFID